MKELKIKSEGINYTALDLGEFNKLMDYTYIHPRFRNEVEGKVFIGEVLKTTGVEISFQILMPDKSIPFLHKHKLHEEVYIILKGSGQFQVDQNIFDIQEGSIIRISPDGSRTLRNNSTTPMIFMVIQSAFGSLKEYFIFDGFRVRGEISWNE